MTRFLHALHKSRRCGLYTFECLQIYSKVKTLRQVCEDKGNEAMVLLSSGRDVKASMGLDSTTCTKSELVASTLKE